jgi:hypothetical protein
MAELLFFPQQRGCMADKKRTQKEIIAEMAQIIVAHLETMPVEEQERRLTDFEATIKGDAKRVSSRPKAPRASGRRRSSRRIPA